MTETDPGKHEFRARGKCDFLTPSADLISPKSAVADLRTIGQGSKSQRLKIRMRLLERSQVEFKWKLVPIHSQVG